MNNPVDKINYRGKRISVYDDDYGQSYYFMYNGKPYSCGTYNLDYIGEIVAIIDDDLDKVFYVDTPYEHRPSAKVYQRHGIWYMDYSSYDGILLSYGDLLKKDKRPTRDDLVAKAREFVDAIENEE